MVWHFNDTADIGASGMPVFAMGSVPAAAEKEGPWEINGLISCGGVAVNPGDLVVGDDDGVVVVPREKIASVVAAAKAKAIHEQKKVLAIAAGEILPDWVKARMNEIGVRY